MWEIDMKMRESGDTQPANNSYKEPHKENISSNFKLLKVIKKIWEKQ